MGIACPDAQETYTVNGVQNSISSYYKISTTTATANPAIKSTAFTATASKDKPVSVISVKVKTLAGSTATVSLHESTNLVATKSGISTNGNWEDVTFYVITTLDSSNKSTLSLNLVLSLDKVADADAERTVYFYAATSGSTTQKVYDDHKAQNKTNEVFWNDTTYFGHNGVRENSLYQVLAANYSIESEQSTSFGGVIDLELIDEGSVFANYDLVSPTNDNKGEFLALYTNNGNVTATHLSGDTTTLTGYVKLKTNILVCGTGSAILSIGSLATFEIDADNSWHALEVLIKTGSNSIGTLNPTLLLSSEGEAIVLADEIEFSTIGSAKYKSATESSTTKLADISESATIDDDSNQSAAKKSKSKVNWVAVFFIALSSTLLVVAVLAAVVARAVKRLPKRTVVNLPTSGYGKKKSGKGGKKGFV